MRARRLSLHFFHFLAFLVEGFRALVETAASLPGTSLLNQES